MRDIERLAKKAGEIILTASDIEITEKSGRRDLVTSKDIEIQNMLTDELSKLYPGCSFLCEETDSKNACDISKGICFIIDPIDGTANFVHGNRHSCTSIAMTKDGETLIGVVYDPYRDELFSAEKGKGAFLNGKKLPSFDSSIDSVISVFGTAPYDDSTNRPTFDLALLLYEMSADVRRTGSAALDLCWTAAGRFGIYAELSLSAWDFAAGKLIAEETGCIVTDIDGNPLSFDGKPTILCGRKTAYEEFIERYRKERL